MDLTWSLDYCLACDRQTSGGAYCSQSCRLADLETSSTWSGTLSPNTTTAAAPSSSSSSSSSSSTDTQRGSGFYLSPAINFANYKTVSSPSPAMSSTASATTQPNSTHLTYFSANFTNPPSTKGLTPSSSISSLSSNSSSDSSQHQLSEQIHSELRAYTNAFDTTRNWRRRTWS